MKAIKSKVNRWKGKLIFYKTFFKFYSKSVKHSFELRLVQDNLHAINDKDIVLFSTMKNETHRLEYFIDYYRNMGVKHFIMVDNDSNDGMMALVSEYSDVTVYHTKGSYKDSNFGMHWLNYLLNKHGIGKWCFTCDPDEFFVFAHDDSRDLIDLTQYLDSIEQKSLFTVMVDMYGKGSIEESNYLSGQNPVKACPYFDGFGYSKQFNSHQSNLFVQGGVRRRVFAKDKPENAPALNKVPLIKWQFGYAYTSSMHMAIPNYLNKNVNDHQETGALLHFKFIAQLQDKVAVELEAKQHYNDSAEYKQYGAVIQDEQILFDPSVSVKFENWKTLADIGLINKGEWR